MALIDHDEGVILLCEVADLVHRGYIAVHGEHTVGADDAETLSLTVTLRDVPTSAAIAIDFADGLAVADDPVEADAFAVLKDAQMLYMTKEHAYRAIRELGKDALPALSTLEDLHGVGAQTKYQSHMPQPVIQALAEVLTRN